MGGTRLQPTAEQLVELLGLQPHPTCGLVAQTFKSTWMLSGEALPPGFAGSRPAGSVLCFMVTPTTRIVMHRIPADQMYHHYLGDPLEVLLLYADGGGEVRVMGRDLLAGERPQLLIPGGTFHMSRVRGPSGYALLGTSEWIGVEPADVETGDRARLSAAFPAMREAIASFMTAKS